jgi:hypothetical protein
MSALHGRRSVDLLRLALIEHGHRLALPNGRAHVAIRLRHGNETCHPLGWLAE